MYSVWELDGKAPGGRDSVHTSLGGGGQGSAGSNDLLQCLLPLLLLDELSDGGGQSLLAGARVKVLGNLDDLV